MAMLWLVVAEGVWQSGQKAAMEERITRRDCQKGWKPAHQPVILEKYAEGCGSMAGSMALDNGGGLRESQTKY